MSITMHADEPVPGLAPDGRPDPAYAAALGLRPAPGGRRAAAFALDAAAWALLAIPAVIGWVQLVPVALAPTGAAPDVAALVGPLVLVGAGQVLLAAFGITQLALHGRRGVTIGKASLGLRSVNVASFARPGFWRVALRALVLWSAQAVLPLIGPALCFASGARDPEGRGRSWLDRIGRCWVVDARHALDPFDAKALRHARRQAEASPHAERPALPSLATDRAIDERTFIPAARSSSGVVATASAVPASGAEAGAWSPPPLASAPPPASARASDAVVAPGAAPAIEEPRAGTRPSAVLVFADGARHAASGTILLGRSPARAEGDPADAMLLPLADDSMGLSKTHAAVEVGARGVHVVDRWSSNGTGIVAADGAVQVLEPGVRHAVPAGATVRLGGLEFRVEGVRS
ncbi:RDD family protein [Agromyces aurantiacus]|uniref:RDD family protein n=1 Tax=Agromyces aurantiacus TaxID=165814 RepID=A0ABV9R4X9_9MICO|nr:RDD family protein [Agromyces aurantiacus]MBM7505726.1 putative RDD family membrane protein YckC [Agromyces aurantiacus]